MAEVTHNIKCWPEPFEEMLAGRKTAEFRLNDRDYKTGDTLLIREWSPVAKEYTHREIMRKITHVLGEGFGIPEGFVMLSLATSSAAEIASLRQWRDAIEGQLVSCHLGTADDFADARAALHALIECNQKIALDPAVSEGARDLIASRDEQIAALQAENEQFRTALCDLLYGLDGARETARRLLSHRLVQDVDALIAKLKAAGTEGSE